MERRSQEKQGVTEERTAIQCIWIHLWSEEKPRKETWQVKNELIQLEVSLNLFFSTCASLQQCFNRALNCSAPRCSWWRRHQQQSLQHQHVFQLANTHHPLLQLQWHCLPLWLKLTHTHISVGWFLKGVMFLFFCLRQSSNAWRLSTLLSARLVMLALAARWATSAASRAAAVLWDWTHVVRTCCHQGEIDCVSHDSSTAPKRRERKRRGHSYSTYSSFPVWRLLLEVHISFDFLLSNWRKPPEHQPTSAHLTSETSDELALQPLTYRVVLFSLANYTNTTSLTGTFHIAEGDK